MRRILPILSVLLGLAVPAVAEGFLPAEFAGWHASSVVLNPPLSENEFAGPYAAIVSEAGFLRAERGEYSQGSRRMSITLLHMKDSTAAYSAYSFLRTPEMVGKQITENSAMSPDHAVILVGDLILDVTGSDLGRDIPGLKTLAGLLEARADRSPYPTLWEHLPVEGLELRSDRFALGPAALNQVMPLGDGDWIGFDNGAEAELARYRVAGKEITLLIAEFPTQQLAAKHLEDLGLRFNLNSPVEANDGRPRLFARRISALVAVVEGAPDLQTAEGLLSQIHYSSEVTWNEPKSTFTEPSFAVMLKEVFVGTGIIAMFTMVASLAFGAVRLAVKKMLPGKVFDRDQSVEILQLGLSSKPIEAKDLYSS